MDKHDPSHTDLLGTSCFLLKSDIGKWLNFKPEISEAQRNEVIEWIHTLKIPPECLARPVAALNAEGIKGLCAGLALYRKHASTYVDYMAWQWAIDIGTGLKGHHPKLLADEQRPGAGSLLGGQDMLPAFNVWHAFYKNDLPLSMEAWERFVDGERKVKEPLDALYAVYRVGNEAACFVNRGARGEMIPMWAADVLFCEKMTGLTKVDKRIPKLAEKLRDLDEKARVQAGKGKDGERNWETLRAEYNYIVASVCPEIETQGI